jgi:hypothetical protein
LIARLMLRTGISPKSVSLSAGDTGSIVPVIRA